MTPTALCVTFADGSSCEFTTVRKAVLSLVAEMDTADLHRLRMYDVFHELRKRAGIVAAPPKGDES